MEEPISNEPPGRRTRWVVGMDGSDGSLTALRWAVQQSAGRPVRLESVRAAPRTVGNRLVRRIKEALSPARRSDEPAGATAAGTAAGAAANGDLTELAVDHDVEARIVDGPAGRVLVDAASRAALLVVGRHGAGGGWRNALGSVSRYCVTHAPCPTVVVPPDWSGGPVRRIVVGFDGSAHACAALGWALDFADDGTDVRALVALEVAPWLQEDVVHARLGDEVEAERVRLLGLLATADPAGRATADVQIRGAKAALARAAGSADLVAVGARGAGPVAGMGSVSTWLLDDSPCPVVVVPATPR